MAWIERGKAAIKKWDGDPATLPQLKLALLAMLREMPRPQSDIDIDNMGRIAETVFRIVRSE